MHHEFDRNLDLAIIQSLPDKSGVYLFKDENSQIIYIGKAKNLKKRLNQYRLAGRKKNHRKMRAIIEQSQSVEYYICSSEKEALLLENQLIQVHRPSFNIAGAYSFLYPYLGLKFQNGPSRCLSICYTTLPEQLENHGFELFGAFRSRDTVNEAFEALFDIMPFIGHHDLAERSLYGDIPYSRIAVFRQVDADWQASFKSFFRGESADCLVKLCAFLLEKPGARRAAPVVQVHLKKLKYFYLSEAVKLRLALREQGLVASQISQNERDRIFINLGS